jgi:DNA primase
VNTATVDLLALIGQDVTLRKHAAKDGGEYIGSCPWCGGEGKRDADRFHVWPNAETPRYWCRRCDRKGDAIQYVRDREHLTYPEALARLGLAGNGNGNGAASSAAAPVIRPRHDPATPPPEEWQARAIGFCQETEAQLWAPEGERALAWLTETRGLTPETILTASLGYNPEDHYEERAAWGLPPENDEQGRPKRVWLPRGIVIPWGAGGHVWRVNIRRPVGDPKYYSPAGCGPGLYRADTVAPGPPAVLVEGELDALTVDQYAGGIVAAVATGSTHGARRARWLALLAQCWRVLVSFDSDPPGEEAAGYWLGVLANARRWRPYYGKDPNGQAVAGGDVRAWVLAGLEPD